MEESNINQETLFDLLDTIQMVKDDVKIEMKLERSKKAEYIYMLTWSTYKYHSNTLEELIAFMDGILNGAHMQKEAMKRVNNG